MGSGELGFVRGIEQGSGGGFRDSLGSLRREHPLLSVWVVAAAIFFGLGAVWAIATPVGATNDEGAQVVKAASVVRGQILGTPLTPQNLHLVSSEQAKSVGSCEYLLAGGGTSRADAVSRCEKAFTIVSVPQSFTEFASPGTCNSLDYIPDTCPTHLSGASRSVDALTYVGRYPPLYYALVGLPSLVSQTNAAVYGMRLISALLTAIFVGLAIALAATYSSRRLLLMAVVLAATPMLLVFGSAVNASALEMSSSLCLWTGLLVLVLEHPAQPPRSLVVACVASAVTMVLSRPLSLFWFLATLVFVAALSPRAVRSLAADRWVRRGSAVVAAAIVLAAAYVLWADPLHVLPVGRPVPANDTLPEVLRLALGSVSNWAYDFGGAFGWALSNPPLLVAVLLGFAISAVALVAFLTGDRTRLAVLGVLGAAAFVVPVAIVASQATKDGIVWQARDGFPLYCGVILVAGAVARPWRWQTGSDVLPAPGESGGPQRLVVLLASIVGVVQLADVYWALRRYTVGLWGPFNVLAPSKGKWVPPVPISLLVIAAVCLSGLYSWYLVRLAGRMPGAGVSPSQPGQADQQPSRPDPRPAVETDEPAMSRPESETGAESLSLFE